MAKNEQWLQPVSKKNLSIIVTDKIKEAMISGQLKPGDYLPSEKQLVESLNVGKSSIREAEKMLEAIGVIEIVKGHGCRIRTNISPDALDPLAYQLIMQNNTDHENLVEFRCTIETAASCLAVEKISDDEILKLQNIETLLEREVKIGHETVDIDIEFHKNIYNDTHNPFLACVGNAIMDLFKPSMTISNRDYPEIVIQNHRQILKAFSLKSKNDMEEAIKQSITKWEELTL